MPMNQVKPDSACIKQTKLDCWGSVTQERAHSSTPNRIQKYWRKGSAFWAEIATHGMAVFALLQSWCTAQTCLLKKRGMLVIIGAFVLTLASVVKYSFREDAISSNLVLFFLPQYYDFVSLCALLVIHGSKCGRTRPGFGWQAVSQKLPAIQYYIV